MTREELLHSKEYITYHKNIGMISDNLIDLIDTTKAYTKPNVKELASALCAANLSILCRITDGTDSDFYDGIRKAITVIQQGVDVDYPINSKKIAEVLRNLVSSVDRFSSPEDMHNVMFLSSCFSVLGASVTFYEQFNSIDFRQFNRYVSLIDDLNKRLLEAIEKE